MSQSSLTYRIDTGAGIVEIVGHDSAASSIEAVILAALADPQYRPGFGFLRDRRGLATPSTAMIWHRVELLRRVVDLQKTRWAIVIDPDPASYGMGRMAQELTKGSGAEVGIFTNIDQARQWLAHQPVADESQP